MIGGCVLVSWVRPWRVYIDNAHGMWGRCCLDSIAFSYEWSWWSHAEALVRRRIWRVHARII